MKRTFSQGEIIFNEGDKGECFYDILDGSVGIYVNYGTPDEKQLTVVESGHILGELAIIDMQPRSATAVALSEVTVERVNGNELDGYFSYNPKRIKYIITELGEKIVRLTGQNSDVRATLKTAVSDDGDKKPGIIDKIKKFAAEYSIAKKQAAVSTETKKAKAREAVGEPFIKAVDDYKKGELVFKEGEKSHCMYYIQTGWVDVFLGYGQTTEKKINTLGAGMFFGEIGLIRDRDRTATAIVGMDHTMIESFGLNDFEEMFKKNPLKVRLLVEYFAERVRTLTITLVDGLRLAYELSKVIDSGSDTSAISADIKSYLKK